MGIANGHYGRLEVRLLVEAMEIEFGIQVEEGRSPYLRQEGGERVKRRVGWDAMEGSELEELAGRQEFGF